ncbi:hypothetical protein QQF64_026566 [Cirrhinus molitorella]|uniref:J domain-containing protein n=1 Tax=Cirrhinus molitorella TaxID=172907 RepID=A0ABR3NA00_9TELE
MQTDLHQTDNFLTSFYFRVSLQEELTVTVNKLCWKCGSSAGLFFCSSCNVIQPPDDKTNYFDILNCEQKFSLDTQKLQKKYVELQRALHPDNFSQKSLKEQEYSEEQSALVNKAYRTLQKPLSRAVYMLELQGVLLEEGTDASADPAFLLEVMDINESLAETRSQDEVSAIGRSVREKLKDLTELMNSSLNKGDLLTAKELLAQMKYFTNIEEKAATGRKNQGVLLELKMPLLGCRGKHVTSLRRL